MRLGAAGGGRAEGRGVNSCGGSGGAADSEAVGAIVMAGQPARMVRRGGPGELASMGTEGISNGAAGWEPGCVGRRHSFGNWA